MTTQSPKAAAKFEYTMKGGISQNSESILRALFNALFVADRHGIKTDHSPSNTEVMTLDLYQIQQVIRNHCDTLYTQIDIVDALFGLASPQLIHSPATTAFISELDGKRIDAVQLEYSADVAKPIINNDLADAIAYAMRKVSQTAKHLYIPPTSAPGQTKLKPTPIWPEFKLQIPEFDGPDDSCIAIDALKKKCAHLEYQNRFLEQMQDLDAKTIADLKAEYDRLAGANKSLETSSNHFKTAADNWRSNAFENYENYEIAQATIAALRSTIMELTETLQAADSDARVSLTSRELLQLMTANSDSNDLSF